MSDQVKEGKYGLIQNELFEEPPKRPGVISYDSNPDTPFDNKDNLGGLNDDDIWLAENSLLVLKGGSLSEKSNDEPWKPIDGYKAGKRPVKIPSNPKVPPPFPVQLDEDGPVEFLGGNPFPVFNPFTNETVNLLSPDGLPRSEPYYNPVPFPFLPNSSFLPPGFFNMLYDANQSFANPFLNNLPPPPGPPGYPGFDPNNMTEIDEDDPSLYYPPPYSFEYDSNYTNPVPPGPLVPGIVLPPPPNYFSRLNDTKPLGKTAQDVITRLQKINARTKLFTTTESPEKAPSSTTPYGRTILRITSSTEPSRSCNRGSCVDQHNGYGRTTTAKPVQSTKLFTTTSRPTTTVFYNYFESKDSTTTTTRRPNRPSYKEIVQQPLPEPVSTAQPVSVPVQVPMTRYMKPTVRPSISNTYLPVKSADYDKYVYITPKPEVNSNNNNGPDEFVPINNIQLLPSPQSQLKSFEHEIETIKQTLRFYQTTTPATRAATTSKAVYEYSFDTRGNDQGYGFRPIIPEYSNRYQYESASEAPYYPSSTILSPYNKPRKSKGSQLFENYYKDPVTEATTEYPLYRPTTSGPNYYQNNPGSYNQQYSNQVRDPPGFVSIEKQILRELIPHPFVPQGNGGRNRLNQGYYHQQPLPPRTRPLERVIINNQTYIVYRIRTPSLHGRHSQRHHQITNPNYPVPPSQQDLYRHQQHHHPQHQQQQTFQRQQQPIPLDSDISVNYKYPLPQINPDSEFIPLPEKDLKSSSLIRYRLPGDQAHVFFLPPIKKKR